MRQVVQRDDREQHRDDQFEQVDSIHFQVTKGSPMCLYRDIPGFMLPEVSVLGPTLVGPAASGATSAGDRLSSGGVPARSRIVVDRDRGGVVTVSSSTYVSLTRYHSQRLRLPTLPTPVRCFCIRALYTGPMKLRLFTAIAQWRS